MKEMFSSKKSFKDQIYSIKTSFKDYKVRKNDPILYTSWSTTMSETGPEIKFNCQSLLTAFLDRKYIVVLKKIVIQIKVVAYCAPEAFKDDLT